MKIIITQKEASDKGIWLKLCSLKGFNEWAIAEGLMDKNEKIILTEEEAKSLGLI